MVVWQLNFEPLSATSYGMYGAILLAAGKFDEAMAACITGTDLDAHSYISHLRKGWRPPGHLQQFDEAAGAFFPL